MSEVRTGIGLLGGTFDPVHNGHLIVAEWLCEVLRLKKTFFIPNQLHPFEKRTDILPGNVRKEMLALAIEGYTDFSISDFELERDSISYTIDTVNFFKEKYPNEELYYFIGMDNLNDFLKWKDPMGILEKAYLVVYNRTSQDLQNDLLDHSRVLSVDSPIIDISSSHIRNRIKKNIPFKSLVPHRVFEYIIQNKLYVS